MQVNVGSRQLRSNPNAYNCRWVAEHEGQPTASGRRAVSGAVAALQAMRTMWDSIKALLKQPYWVITLLLGAVLVMLPSVTVDEDFHWSTHSPTTYLPVGVGIGLMLWSAVAFWLASPFPGAGAAEKLEGGLD
jgi:hypothetical protein